MRLALKLSGLLGTVALGVVLSASAQEQPADFAVQVPLSVVGEGPWYRLELGLSLQLNTKQTDLIDVRVFNAAAEPQAYALVRQTAQSRETLTLTDVKRFPLYGPVDASPPSAGVRVKTDTNGTLVEMTAPHQRTVGNEVLRGWLLDASSIKVPLQQLILDWDNKRDGFQRFSIEASDDLQHWRAWGAGQVARLSFADQRIEQREVRLPGQSARYLRLLWDSSQPAPELTSAQLQSASVSTVLRELDWSSPLAGSRVNAGEYIWQLPARLNIERVQVELTRPNSLAPVKLYGRTETTKPWQALSAGMLFRLTQNGQEVEQNELLLSGKPVQELRLIVDERGTGLGAQAPTLKVAVSPAQLVFLASGAGPYTLALGSMAAKATNLPLAILIPDYSAAKMATLDKAQVNGDAQTASPSKAATSASDTNWKKIGLWAVLLLGVLGLAAMAFSLLRKP